MSKHSLKNDFETIIEKEANNFFNKLLMEKDIIEAIKPFLRIAFRKIMFVNLRILILLKAIEKFGNHKCKNLKNSLQTCEYHINSIWEELYKLLC